MSHFSFECDNCGQKFKKWQAFCTKCKSVNQIQEIKNSNSKLPFLHWQKAEKSKLTRYLFPSNEINNLFGGGLAYGSITLISGEPGVGKTTILLKLMHELKTVDANILYVNSEEGLEQIAQKIKVNTKNLYIAHTTNIDAIISDSQNFQIIVIDSIQTIMSENCSGMPGSINQVKNAVFKLVEFAKNKNITIIIVGHINKNGDIAGPKILEHMVDTVFYINHQNNDLKSIKCHKNRFGSTQEILLLKMYQQEISVIENPEAYLIDLKNQTGAVITSHLEGTRTILCEIEVLTARTLVGHPKRIANGLKLNKLNLLLAVMEKYNKMSTLNKDVYINIRHNFQITDEATDLSICIAIIASMLNRQIPPKIAFIGEVSLNGKINHVNQIMKHINLLIKYGFKTIYIPKNSKMKISNINLKCVETVEDVIFDLFKRG